MDTDQVKCILAFICTKLGKKESFMTSSGVSSWRMLRLPNILRF